MGKGRLEAFSDGVIAIVITIMVLELKQPAGTSWSALASHDVTRPLFAYVLSFVYVAIYWNNHHHLMHASDRLNGRILWANMQLLFWLSLVPFATAWVGEHEIAPVPTAIYGVIMLLAGLSYVLLQREIIREQGPSSRLRAMVGRDAKGKASAVLYAVAIPIAFFNPWLSIAIYVANAIMWIVPDRRIEQQLGH